ncbi:hypothetical protein Z517_09230 [Fonsecaea pedrosoi CBS 271.37]|uniref:Uncharacterized protein n=1 Tax=Fonsecaea pedrosoi CBS 271.37 TaxID=1442368 RepID=A0A0D2DGH4_9EURO|nr:uncharacterized protein Z517_09230 [Fonsecaea pedrosoi CBS 271.37]KIW76786.1 hypothetical protein Z517_09230 [Fonsecaea pedrosoi CBS 271.37]
MENMLDVQRHAPIRDREVDVLQEPTEKDRRERVFKIVPKYKMTLNKIYRPMVAREYFSLLFRQRGSPSIDMFTSEIIKSVRQALGYNKLVTNTVTRILVLGKWTTSNCRITM